FGPSFDSAAVDRTLYSSEYSVLAMALKLAHMLATSGLQPAPIAPRRAWPELIRQGAPAPAGAEPDEPDSLLPQAARGPRIWELDASLHCSIIGTCLTNAELRRVLDKLKIGPAGAASDHELHGLGVRLAGRRADGAKVLQKALDRRHQAAIDRYAEAKDPAGLLAMWEDSLKQGDVPGAYWAALTHPAATVEVVKRAFGDVHMLSHLVGAANRADIRRLRQLEKENAELAAKIERQQRQLHDGFAARDLAIRRLNDLLARQAGERVERRDPGETPAARAALDALVADLERRLAREVARREHGDARVAALSATLREKERALAAVERDGAAARQELELGGRQLGPPRVPQTPAFC